MIRIDFFFPPFILKDSKEKQTWKKKGMNAGVVTTLWRRESSAVVVHGTSIWSTYSSVSFFFLFLCELLGVRDLYLPAVVLVLWSRS